MLNSNKGAPHPLNDAFSLIARFCDVAIIWLILYCLHALFNITASGIYLFASLLAAVYYLIVAEVVSAFRYPRLENYGDTIEKIVIAWTLTSLFLILSAVLTKTSAEFSRLTIITWLLCTPIFLIGARLLIKIVLNRLHQHPSNARTYIVLGNPKLTRDLPEKIAASASTQLTYMGSFGDLEELLLTLKNNPIDYIFLAYPSNDQDKIASAIKALSDSTASTYLIPDLLLTDFLGSRWIMMGNTPLIIINDHPFYGGQWALKKVEDLFLGFILLLCALPVMAIIALLIKLTSPGPVFFRQRRHGLNGEVIRIYKFRTMTSMDDGDVVVQAKKGDERITKIGKFLRRTSLDELPQFFNVLQGEMSIVGPRPHALAHNEYYRNLIDGYMQRHKVKPGITGWAQVHGFRGETDTLEKMQSRVDYDRYYINHWSIGLDLKIILLTIIFGFTGKRAY
jgi:putative colanic acid biosynthesis UDP-glucose lipid carrier transferase